MLPIQKLDTALKTNQIYNDDVYDLLLLKRGIDTSSPPNLETLYSKFQLASIFNNESCRRSIQ